MSRNDEEFVGIVRESDKEIYEKAQDKFIEHEMKKGTR